MTERQLKNGQVILQKGDPGASLMAVLHGRVKIGAYSEDGKEIILNIVEPGQILGEIALLDGKEHRRRDRHGPDKRCPSSTGATSSRSWKEIPRSPCA